MIDLHLHLDGSLSRDDFVYLSKKQHIALGKDYTSNIMVSDDCTSLDEYLKKFDLPLSLLQNSESLEYVTKSLLDRLYALGVIYAEIRFAPCLHTQKGMTITKAVDSVVEGLYKGLENRKNFDANIILCCMRGASDKENEETVKAALEFRNEKVVALDLAGSEKVRKLSHFKKIFEPAFKANFPVIIHAGEAGTAQDVYDAIEFGAQRIGHGVKVDQTFEVSKYLAMKNVTFEICPTSNVQTKAVKSLEELPINFFLRHGIRFNINSDDMTVSNTDIVNEYKRLVKELGVSKEDIRQILGYAANMAFVSPSKKADLHKLLCIGFEDFYSRLVED